MVIIALSIAGCLIQTVGNMIAWERSTQHTGGYIRSPSCSDAGAASSSASIVYIIRPRHKLHYNATS